jgi:hypothetical protein
MSKQLPLEFEDEWWMEVLVFLSDDQKEKAMVALKEMFVAYVEIKRTRGARDGECRDYRESRQSTQYQTGHSLESQRRQYQLVEKARVLGFREERVTDGDLGLSGSSVSERSGFKKLVAEVSLNKVGIIFGLEVCKE